MKEWIKFMNVGKTKKTSPSHYHIFIGGMFTIPSHVVVYDSFTHKNPIPEEKSLIFPPQRSARCPNSSGAPLTSWTMRLVSCDHGKKIRTSLINGFYFNGKILKKPWLIAHCHVRCRRKSPRCMVISTVTTGWHESSDMTWIVTYLLKLLPSGKLT